MQNLHVINLAQSTSVVVLFRAPPPLSVVVALDDLDCLDLLIWLRTGEQAAVRLGVSQSKVSRTVAAVSQALGIELHKSRDEWDLQGDQTLLQLERRVHQQYRWIRGKPLRIEAQYYSGPLFCDPVPEGWIAGNVDYLQIHTPLQHLRSGVIDAWIGCFPDVPEEDDPDLICFHLTRLPTYLVARPDHPLLLGGRTVTLEDVRQYPSLALADGAFPKVQAALQNLGLWNLTESRLRDLNRYSRKLWEGRVERDLVIGYATAFTIGLFETAQVILPLPPLLEVGDTLVLRREYAEHPRLLELLRHLRLRARALSEQYPDVSLPQS